MPKPGVLIMQRFFTVGSIALLVAFGARFVYGADAPDPEPVLTPAQEQALEDHMADVVAADRQQGPQRFVLKVVDPQGRPVAGVPVRARELRDKPGNPMTHLRAGQGFTGVVYHEVMTDRNGLVTHTAEGYSFFQLWLDFPKLKGQFIVRHAFTPQRNTPAVSAEAALEAQWIERGQSDKIRRTATVTVLPTTGPDKLVKLDYFGTKLLEQEQFRPVTIVLGAFDSPNRRPRAYDPAEPPLDLIVRGSRVAGTVVPVLPPAERGAGLQRGDPAEVYGDACPWWIELEGCHGIGLIDASAEPWPYTAPEDGWRRRLRFGSAEGFPSEQAVVIYVRRPGQTVRYGVFEGVVGLRRAVQNDLDHGTRRDELFLRGTLWINPTGSRNLERPGHRDQGRFWEPAPFTFVSSRDQDQLLATWAAEPPEGQIELLDEPQP